MNRARKKTGTAGRDKNRQPRPKPTAQFKKPSQPPEENDRLEGRNAIQEALRSGRTIHKLWVQKRQQKPDPVLARLIGQVEQTGAPVLEVDRQVLDQMAQTQAHQGIIAQVAAHDYVSLPDLLAAAQAQAEQPFLLVLDEIQDSYNLGAILRVADAAGVHGVIIPRRRSVGLSAVVAKASAGAMEHVPVCRVNNISQTLDQLKAQGFWITGTDADAPQHYQDADWTGALAILVGSEGSGISPALKKHCDVLVSIPMKGRVNSLNAAVATAVVVFEAVRQRALQEKAGNHD